MSKTIYTSISASVYKKPTTQQTIEETIKSVREGSYANVVRRIRAATDDGNRETLIRDCLPVFFPTVRLSADGSLGEDSEPTGIVQFGVIRKDNPKLDFAVLKHEVMKHPACLYAFMSPSRELKFGIQTDFVRATGETSETTKRRFTKAYRFCRHQMRENYSIKFVDDDDMAKIRQSCFLSHDLNAFFRTDCDVLAVNDHCHVAPLETVIPTVNEPTVQLALNHIPKTLEHAARTDINDCVLGMLGRAGIPLLMNHWQTDDRAKLLGQLEDCLNGPKYGNIDLLLSYAEKQGYERPIGGWDRRKIQPQPFDYELDVLATPEESTAQLQSIVHDFVSGTNSHFVNVTAGAGKTRTVLEALSRELDHNAKVLFLVPTHKLAAEVIQNYDKIRQRDIADANDLRGRTRRATIMEFHSRKKLCENDKAKKVLEDRGVSIPVPYCLSQCIRQGNCNYTAQFNDTANIRVMTHHQWNGEQSAWFNGNSGDGDADGDRTEPNKKRFPWVPDFIVVDEDILKIGEAERELISSPFNSVRLIIESVRNGSSLTDAVWAHYEQVLKDGAANVRSYPSPTLSPEAYFEANKLNKATSTYSNVVAQLEKFCLYDDASFLGGMWVGSDATDDVDDDDDDDDTDTDADVDAINWLKLPAVADRYNGIPTLYLDATANLTVVQRLLPGVQFHQIAVRQNEDVRLHQLSNATFSMGHLKKRDKLEAVIEGLRRIAEPYRRVGLITYKQIGSDETFAATLAKKVGAKDFTHFGNLRGLNAMEEVDCLLVVGRHMLPYDTIRAHARAIFGHDVTWKQVYADRPVRMKDGKTAALNTMIVADPWHRAAYEHSSLSETLQAIGRGRPIYGSKKDIYVFSNENLTTNTEVAEFFSYEHYFERPKAPSKPRAPLITQDALEQVRLRGFVRDIEGELVKQLMLTKGRVKPNRDQIEKEMVAAGAHKVDLLVRNTSRDRKLRTYFIFGDTEKLKRALIENDELLITD